MSTKYEVFTSIAIIEDGIETDGYDVASIKIFDDEEEARKFAEGLANDR